MLSIIIPTLNEEKCLPKLLGAIKAQSFKDYEIIVADTNSKDKTRQIAEKCGCRITKGGILPGIARNNGAKIAKGEILLFLDADSLIGKDFIENALSDIGRRKIDVGGCYLYPSSSCLTDKLFLGAFNAWIFMTQLFYPNACGTGIFCKNWLHKKVGGFDEKIRLSEDMDYVKRCGKYGKFRIIKKSKLVFSMRRFAEEGRLNLAIKLFLSALYRLFFGEIKTDIFNYRFQHKK